MYCNKIWGSTYKTNLSKLQAFQNKAVRIVTGSPRRSNSENMYKCSGLMKLLLMKLNYINTYLGGIFMHKVYHKTLPAILMIFSGAFIVYMIMIPGLRAIYMCHQLRPVYLKLASEMKE